MKKPPGERVSDRLECGQRTLDAIGDTPLVELPAIRPPDSARIAVKWEGANPTGSLKDRMALAMVEAARDRGDIEPGDPIVEFTGGSTGSSLAFVCAVLGHPLHIVTADCVATEKIASMRALGATLDVLETPNGEPYDGLFDDLEQRAIARADELDAYFTDQFSNNDQLQGYHPLAKEILSSVPDVDSFVMTVGTGGCAMGTSKGFAAAGADVSLALVEPAESPVLTEGRTGSHRVQGTAIMASPPLVEPDLADRIETIPTEAGVDLVRRLAVEEGLLAGTSTGMNLAAARRIARDLDPSETVVTVACDTGLKYLSDGLYEGLAGSQFCLC